MGSPSTSADPSGSIGRDGTSDAACDGWDNAGCAGTAACPPRCPRFVDKHGARWVLRPAREGDAAALAETYEAFGPADRAQGIPPAVESRRLDWIDTLLAEGYNVVAERDGRLLGHAVYTPIDGERPELAVFVHPDFQGRGIGTELCKHVIAAAAEADREKLVLYVEASNRVAISVYRRLGFEVVKRESDLHMELTLDAEIATSVRAPPVDRPA